METVATIEVPAAPPMVPTPGAGREYLTPEEVAAAYEISIQTVNRWLTVGITAWNGEGHKIRAILRGRKIGGRWKIPPAALADFLRQTGNVANETTPRETETERKHRVDACLKILADQGLL